jgi:hypothetical protein
MLGKHAAVISGRTRPTTPEAVTLLAAETRLSAAGDRPCDRRDRDPQPELGDAPRDVANAVRE